MVSKKALIKAVMTMTSIIIITLISTFYPDYFMILGSSIIVIGGTIGLYTIFNIEDKEDDE